MAKLTNKSTEGTSFQGVTIRTTPRALINLYPDYSNGDKTNFEWELETATGKVFTLYDWNNRNPAEDNVVDFNIGAFDKATALQAKSEIMSDLQKGTKTNELDVSSLYESHFKKIKALKEGTLAYTKEDRNNFLQELRNFGNLGQHVYRSKQLEDVINKVGQMVEVACQVNLSETEAWMDQITVKRHNKRLTESYKLFERTGKEIGMLQQRLESCYEDMAEVFKKYYDI